jgi:hypothetical protein
MVRLGYNITQSFKACKYWLIQQRALKTHKMGEKMVAGITKGG